MDSVCDASLKTSVPDSDESNATGCVGVVGGVESGDECKVSDSGVERCYSNSGAGDASVRTDLRDANTVELPPQKQHASIGELSHVVSTKEMIKGLDEVASWKTRALQEL
eukprot:2414088-Rhodomonas_salina.1